MMSSTDRSIHHQIVPIVLATWAIVWLAGVAFISQYVHPDGEDLLLAQKSRDQGIFQAASEFLMTFDGRYFTNLLHGLSPLAMGWYEGFHITPLITIGIVTLGTIILLVSLTSRYSYFEVIIYAFLFSAISINMAPSLPRQLFVYCGSIVYFLTWGPYFMWLGFFRLHYIQQGNIVYFLLSVTCLWMANGCNEMFLVINGATLLLLIWLVWRSNTSKTIIASVFALLLVYTGTSLFFVSSPGIMFRLAASPATEAGMLLHERMRYGLTEMALTYIPKFFTTGFPAIPVSFLVGLWIHRYRSFELNVTTVQKGLVMAGLMLALALSTAAYYATIAGPGDNADRIYNTVFAGTFLVMIMGWVMILQSRFSVVLLRPFYMILALGIFVISSFMVKDNAHLVWHEWKNGQIAAFDRQVKQRIETIRASAATSDPCKIVYVKAYQQLPQSIWHDSDIAPERKHYYWNRAYERYFYVDEVRLEGDTFKMLF